MSYHLSTISVVDLKKRINVGGTVLEEEYIHEVSVGRRGGGRVTREGELLGKERGPASTAVAVTAAAEAAARWQSIP